MKLNFMAKAFMFAGEAEFSTLDGDLGLIDGAYDLKKEDLICLCLGSPVPFALRACKDGWVLLSPCYLHGYMNTKKRAFDVNPRMESALI